ncbi:MAG: M48 family metallopeptidase [Myxococcaceae bacterium]
MRSRHWLPTVVLSLLCACATAKDAQQPAGDGDDEAKDPKKTEPKSGGAAGSMSSTDLMKIQADAMRIAALSRAAADAADRACSPIETQPLTPDEVRRYGRAMIAAKLDKKAAVTDGAAPRQLAELGLVLARRSSQPNLPWTFGVVRSDLPDAFSGAGGWVFVTTGMLRKLHNEAELAGLLAHEIGHVSLGHAEQSLRKSLATQCRAATTTAELAKAGLEPSPAKDALLKQVEAYKNPPTAGTNDFQSFMFSAMAMMSSVPSKDVEFEADRAGASMLVSAGYDPAAFEELLTRLDAEPLRTDEQGNKVREGYLAFKPAVADRNSKLKSVREGELAPLVHQKARPALSKDLAELQ